MSRFLFVSGCGEGFGLALRLKDEGHEVAGIVKDRHAKENYDGIIRKLDKWDNWLTSETIVVFDSSGGGRTADRLRAQGHLVLCSSYFADQLEKDREFGLSVMESVGIKVPPSESFTSFEKAREYVKSRGDQRMVFKPSGRMGEDLSSYLSSDPEDMVEMLTWFEENSKGTVEFVLQDFIKGFEISTEGWFNGRDWIFPFNHTLEVKSLMNDNIGPSGGCSGNIVWKQEEVNFIIEHGIKLMGPILRQQEFVGPIDLNTIVDEVGTIWGLEFSPRFGYDALPTLLELFEPNSIGNFLSDLAHGTPLWMKLKDGFAGGVRVTLNPYPSDKLPGPKGIPIRGLLKSDRPHLYLYDVALNERGRLVSTEKITLCATGAGASIDEAMNKCYDIVNRSRIPDKQYRTDLAGVLASRHEKFTQLVKEFSPTLVTV